MPIQWMSVPIRLANAADLPTLAALYAAAARTLGPQVYSPAQVAAWASFGTDTEVFRDYILSAQTWVAGEPAQGFCGIDASGEVHSLYVRADLTRQGLGTRLLAHAMVQARRQGVSRFSAWATPFSRPVFERAGLRLVQTVSEPYQGVLFERYRLEGGVAST
jgi:GNAT superfamily N-acetyltransferase